MENENYEPFGMLKASLYKELGMPEVTIEKTASVTSEDMEKIGSMYEEKNIVGQEDVARKFTIALALREEGEKTASVSAEIDRQKFSVAMLDRFNKLDALSDRGIYSNEQSMTIKLAYKSVFDCFKKIGLEKTAKTLFSLDDSYLVKEALNYDFYKELPMEKKAAGKIDVKSTIIKKNVADLIRKDFGEEFLNELSKSKDPEQDLAALPDPVKQRVQEILTEGAQDGEDAGSPVSQETQQQSEGISWLKEGVSDEIEKSSKPAEDEEDNVSNTSPDNEKPVSDENQQKEQADANNGISSVAEQEGTGQGQQQGATDGATEEESQQQMDPSQQQQLPPPSDPDSAPRIPQSPEDMAKMQSIWNIINQQNMQQAAGAQDEMDGQAMNNGVSPEELQQSGMGQMAQGGEEQPQDNQQGGIEQMAQGYGGQGEEEQMGGMGQMAQGYQGEDQGREQMEQGDQGQDGSELSEDDMNQLNEAVGQIAQNPELMQEILGRYQIDPNNASDEDIHGAIVDFLINGVNVQGGEEEQGQPEEHGGQEEYSPMADMARGNYGG